MSLPFSGCATAEKDFDRIPNMTFEFMTQFAKVTALSIAVGALTAGCESASVTPDSAGYKALLSGDYATARNDFSPEQTKAPNDAYLELDLAVAYQQLGRTDLADALNRQAMANGRDIIPYYTTSDRGRGKSIADLACENIARAHHTSSC